jgi:hypothetical protein
VLDTIAAMAPGSSVTLAGWVQEDSGSLMLTASGPRVPHAHEGLTARVNRVAGDAWRDFGEDALTLEWSWRQGSDHTGARSR